jgi:dolichyl-phosphate beta-glucosyltransferase
MTDPHLSIVVPCYDETGRLGASLATILAWTAEQDFPVEVVVVDDGSTDGTAELAESHLTGVPHRVLRHDRNRGKGGALQTGMLAASGRYVLFTDADLSTPIEHAADLLAAHERGAPVVIGSRKTAGSQVSERQSLVRESMGRVFTGLANVVTGAGVSDFTCGFKSFTREAAGDLFGRLREDGWAYDAELLYLARRRGYAVTEVPVTWANDPSTRVRLLRDTLGSALGLLRIRLRALRGEFETRRAGT